MKRQEGDEEEDSRKQQYDRKTMEEQAIGKQRGMKDTSLLRRTEYHSEETSRVTSVLTVCT